MANNISTMKVLIIKPSSLGDVVHALRVVSFIKEKVNSLQIHWVIKSGLEGIIYASGIVDKYFLFYRGGGGVKFLKLGLSLRRENYDLVLDMQGLLRSAVLARLANGNNCYGRPDGRECSTLFYKTVNAPTEKAPHAIERLLPFVEVFNIQKDKKLYLEFLKSRTTHFLKEKLNYENFRILLFPESRRAEKCWPFFKELSVLIQAEGIGDVLVSGTRKDDQFNHTLDLRGKVPLESIPALIRNVSIVISNDSAPLHIASAMNIPTIGIFGPTDPRKYGPYPKGSRSGDTVSSEIISEIEPRRIFEKILRMLTEIEQ